MQDQLAKADRYRKEAAKYHERAKVAQPAYLGDFFRQVAVRYMFMAQEAENGQRVAEKSRRPQTSPTQTESGNRRERGAFGSGGVRGLEDQVHGPGILQI
jgi:hypothetical protein